MRRHSGYERVIEASLELFVALCAQRVARHADEALPEHRQTPFSYDIYRAVQRMEASLEPIALSELAHIARSSVSQFCSNFRNQLGITPHEYHLRLRLDPGGSVSTTGGRDASGGGVNDNTGGRSFVSTELTCPEGTEPPPVAVPMFRSANAVSGALRRRFLRR